jgi:uncharacterized protein
LTRRIKATLENVRRLAVTKQHLAGKLPTKPSADNILRVFRDLGCIQLDPISAVAPSHLIVLWSRIGNFDKTHLERLLWSDRKIFEYWAHQASLVLMEDYPLYHPMMRGFPQTFAKGWGPGWTERNFQWITSHNDLRDYVLGELKTKGALLSRQFEDKTRRKPRGSGWGSSSDVSRMLSNLFFRGDVMVVGRQGNQKLWDLSERFLPRWVSKKVLAADEIEYEAVQRSIRALGTATASEIDYHFLRGRYHHLNSTLKQLVDESRIYPVDIEDSGIGKGERYIHAKDITLLSELETGGWQPRISLLSPFDNLICDRTRTKLLFNFDFTVEIYTPSHKRKYGYYVLPILYGDKLVGRIDPLMNRKEEQLQIKAVHAEPSAPRDQTFARKLRDVIEQFSGFLGAKEVVYSKKVPTIWRSSLR